MARLPVWKVLLFGALSALAWNAGLIALGAIVAAQFEELLGWVRTYTSAVWVVLGAVAFVLIVRIVWQRRRPAA
jgi:membrane protein DedA with SNARE-associated domain